MDDIVERLRAKRVWGRSGHYNPDELCQAAAKEIERLRSELLDAETSGYNKGIRDMGISCAEHCKVCAQWVRPLLKRTGNL